VAVTPDGKSVYVANNGSNTVSVIATATNQVSPIPVGNGPIGVAVTPDGKRVFVANNGSNTVSVIDTTKSPPAVVATVGVGGLPVAFGKFITPASSVFWGVDSLLPATQDLFNALKDQAGATPAFWGRYIGEHNTLSSDELTLMRDNNCRVLVIFRDTTKGQLKSKPEAIQQANRAIALAQKLGVPSGVWIYADTELDQSPTAEWFAGWFVTLQDPKISPYGAGVYGNTSTAKFQMSRFGTAFCAAYPHFPNPAAAYVYTNQPEPGCNFKNPNFNPTILPCHPQTVIQQYAQKCIVPNTGGRQVDLDLANATGFASMWKP
jgi:YVTN family beta-propeller protein